MKSLQEIEEAKKRKRERDRERYRKNKNPKTWSAAIPLQKITTPDDGWYFLCSDIIRVAIRDWRRVCKVEYRDRERHKLKRSLIDFFMSDLFELYCDIARLDIEVVLDKLDIDWRSHHE